MSKLLVILILAALSAPSADARLGFGKVAGPAREDTVGHIDGAATSVPVKGNTTPSNHVNCGTGCSPGTTVYHPVGCGQPGMGNCTSETQSCVCSNGVIKTYEFTY